MKKTKNKYIAVIGYTVLFSIGFFIIFGVITALIQNKFFVRMVASSYLDYIFLIFTSVLLGAYTSFHINRKKHSNKICSAAAYSGGVFGFLGFGCSICNQILVLLLGVAGVLTYVEPYRPFIGSVGVGLMSYAVYTKAKKTGIIN